MHLSSYTNLNMRNVILAAITITLVSGFHPINDAIPDNTRPPEEIKKLENPFTAQYLKTHLKKSTPRLVLTPAIEKELHSKLKTDPVTKNYFQTMLLNADGILKQPLLERKMEGPKIAGCFERDAL
jgi:hypothetical protein